jgi:hypothetical protein
MSTIDEFTRHCEMQTIMVENKTNEHAMNIYWIKKLLTDFVTSKYRRKVSGEKRFKEIKKLKKPLRI